MKREPLTRQEVINAIERKGGAKVPCVFHKWWGVGLEEKYGTKLIELAKQYPEDLFVEFYSDPGEHKSYTQNPEYRWGYKESYNDTERHSIAEAHVLLPDWEELDLFIDNFPNPNEPGNFLKVEEAMKTAGQRYKLGCWWRLFHERFWSTRGMENLMIDYYDNMDELKKLGKALLEYYKVIIDRFAGLGFDGIFTSDDLGHQTGPMMSPAIFEELYFPLYKEIIDYIHNKGMHVFLHSCGDNTKLMPYLVEAGLDVFHPIQAGCMDIKATAEKFGNSISFLAGVDVQHLLPEGTTDQVKEGILSMMDTLYKPSGGLLMAAGNGIMPDTPLENIEVTLDTITLYK